MKASAIEHIGIVGTGMIGASLAALFTGNRYRTTLYALNDVEATAGRQRYDQCYQDLVAKKLVTPGQAAACARLLTVTQSYGALFDADFLFECVVERLEVKHAVYQQIEQHCRKVRAIASSTSAISATTSPRGSSGRISWRWPTPGTHPTSCPASRW